jgi:hypothetical protein
MPDESEGDIIETGDFGGRKTMEWLEHNNSDGQDLVDSEEPRLRLIRRMLSHSAARQLLDIDQKMLFASNHKFSS